MTSKRPYLIRAMHEWIVDNGATPHILVDAQKEGVEVPTEYIQDGKIVLNISPAAVRDLQLNNDWILFSARFRGRAMQASIPTSAVMAIYARENGQGMLFNEAEDSPPSPPEPPPTKRSGKPSLKVVK
jgi:stringent starvation protein B